MFVVVVTGLPMWWKTTEVYRVSLPYDEIAKLNASNIKITQRILIFTAKSETGVKIKNSLQANFMYNHAWKIDFKQISSIDVATKSPTPASLERKILAKFPLTSGDLLIMEWPNSKDEIVLTTDQTIYITENSNVENLGNLLQDDILQTQKVLSFIQGRSHFKVGIPELQNYDISISAFVSSPETFQVKWNAPQAIQNYLQTYLQQISGIANFTVKSQWRHQLKGIYNFKEFYDRSKRTFGIYEDALPYFLNSLEKRLGSSPTDNPSINIIVFIASCETSPLFIYKQNGQRVTDADIDSFISPKWGGIIFYNPPAGICDNYVEGDRSKNAEFEISSKDVMQSSLVILQKIIGLNAEIKTEGVRSLEVDSITPRIWEYEAYIRKITINHIYTSINTLQSLVTLLDEISYIVINEEVGQGVKDAYHNILLALQFLNEGDLYSSSQHADIAFQSSERAFFDASLLAQLYFPDEQKYAIYIPLFLPIMLPVISSVSTILRFFFVDKLHNKDR